MSEKNEKQKLAEKKFDNKCEYIVNSKLNISLAWYHSFKSFCLYVGLLLLIYWISGQGFVSIIGKILSPLMFIYGTLNIQDNKGDFW